MKQSLRYLLFVCVVALWATIFFIVPDFLDNPIEGIKDVATILVYIIALGIGNFFLLYAIFSYKHVAAVLIPIYFVLGAAVAYYRYAYHVTITAVMLDVTFHTNPAEAAGVMSWQLFMYVLLNLCVAIGFVVFRYKKICLQHSYAHVIAACLLFTLYFNINGRLHVSMQQRYPMNIVCSLSDYVRMQSERSSERTMPSVTIDADVENLDVVVVIGEALRADHLGINGYVRPTTPLLEQRENVVSLPHIYSQHTHTAASLPHLLTPADSTNVELAYTSHSFIPCFSQAGFNTAWLSNQDYGHTYTCFISEADTAIFPNAGKSVFVFHPWYDEDLLSPLDVLLNDSSNQKNLFVLHCIGSHWYYNNHVPEQLQQFQPVTTNRVITSNTPEQICNSYDNTALYLDFFLDSLISRFVDRTAIVFYLSDHGESLGENNTWLHAAGAEETKYPAAIVWYSDKYAALFPEKVNALKDNSQKHYRSDYLFYSVLSSAGIEAEGNNLSFNILYR